MFLKLKIGLIKSSKIYENLKDEMTNKNIIGIKKVQFIL